MANLLNKSKLLDYFDASKIKEQFHIIGCGAIGSHICDLLARMGVEKIHLYDFDVVEPHNITNQRFTQNHIGSAKVLACKDMIESINPQATVVVHMDGLQEPYICNGIILMCVDSIELRQKILLANKFNPNCTCISDYRMRMTDAQHYFASNKAEYDKMYKTMDFTHEEAVAATPVSACNVVLSVPYTVAEITALGIANLTLFLLGKPYKTVVLNNTALLEVDSF